MDPTRFDDLTKALATATSRRQALKTIAATTIGGMLGLGGIGTAFGKPKCHRQGTGCDTTSQCCSGLVCTNGKCTPCTGNGGTCSGNGECCSGTCCQGMCCGSGQVCLSNGTCATPCSGISCSGPCGTGTCDYHRGGGFYCVNTTVPEGGFCVFDTDCPKGYFCEGDDLYCVAVC